MRFYAATDIDREKGVPECRAREQTEPHCTVETPMVPAGGASPAW